MVNSSMSLLKMLPSRGALWKQRPKKPFINARIQILLRVLFIFMPVLTIYRFKVFKGDR